MPNRMKMIWMRRNRDQLVDDYTLRPGAGAATGRDRGAQGVVEQARGVRENAADSKLAALKKCLGESHSWN